MISFDEYTILNPITIIKSLESFYSFNDVLGHARITVVLIMYGY